MNPSKRKKLYRISLLENSQKVVEEKIEQKPVEPVQEKVEPVKEVSDVVAEPEVTTPVVSKKSKKTI